MNTAELRALQAEILANPSCAPYIHMNAAPPISGADAAAKDQAIADILNVGRTKLQPRPITEKGIRLALEVVPAAKLLKTLEDLSGASSAPQWLTDELNARQIPMSDQWAYLDTLRSGWFWLRTEDGFDLSTDRVREMLDLVAASGPTLPAAAATLKSLAEFPNPVTAADVSRAIRGPWGDE